MFIHLELFPQARVLDVGCGDGSFSAWLALKVPQGFVLGIDNQPAAIEESRSGYPEHKFPNLRFQLADARQLDFVAEPFDFAVTRNCLHYLEHPGLAFAPMARHLKPGGSLHAQCLGRGTAANVISSVSRQIRRRQWRSQFQGFRFPWAMVEPQACVPWLERASLEPTYLGLLEEPLEFADKKAFLDWVPVNWSPYWKRIPRQVESFLQELGERHAPSSGPVRTSRQWLQVEAKKKNL